MRKCVLYIAGVLLLAFASCSKGNQFTIKGNVDQAAGETLYLEAWASNQATVIDSIKLDEQGAFTFKKPATEYPEFYRLRLVNNYINLAIDSTETISITTQANRFGELYTVEGSDNCSKIKDITLLGSELKREMRRLEQLAISKEITPQQYQEQVLDHIANYKKEIIGYVYEDPRSLAAYYVIFQSIYSYTVFNPYNKEDMKPIAAVATSFSIAYPDWHRTTRLKEIAVRGIAHNRAQSAPAAEVAEPTIAVNETSYIEIELPNVYGKKVKLSDHIGKVILLDFTSYQSEYSPAYNMQLAALYEKYKKRGFEIFQVSLDSYVNFWQVSASNLPWICVRDPQTTRSLIAATYNVTSLPTTYLLNKKGEIVVRPESMEQLEKEIAKLL